MPFLLLVAAAPVPLPPGLWGDGEARLEIGADRASLRIGCTEGEFGTHVPVSGDGRFTASGYWLGMAAGPQRDDAPAGTPARFEGRIDGDRLVLKVHHAGASQRFDLTRGRSGPDVRCY